MNNTANTHGTQTGEGKLTGQAAIDFAIKHGVALLGHDFSGHSTGGLMGRILGDIEAQQMVDEGIIEGVWCWTSADPRLVDDDLDPGEAGNIMEDEDCHASVDAAAFFGNDA